MNAATITKMENTVNYMNETGWTALINTMNALEDESRQYLGEVQCDGYIASPLRRMFIELATVSMEISEIKYNGYMDLIANALNFEHIPSISAKHNNLLTKAESKRNRIISEINETIHVLQGLQTKIMQLGDLPKGAV
jgi:septin family protein